MQGQRGARGGTAAAQQGADPDPRGSQADQVSPCCSLARQVDLLHALQAKQRVFESWQPSRERCGSKPLPALMEKPPATSAGLSHHGAAVGRQITKIKEHPLQRFLRTGSSWVSAADSQHRSRSFLFGPAGISKRYLPSVPVLPFTRASPSP